MYINFINESNFFWNLYLNFFKNYWKFFSYYVYNNINIMFLFNYYISIIIFISNFKLIRDYIKYDYNDSEIIVLNILKAKRGNNIKWLDIWEINIINFNLENINKSPWNLYEKYKLSIFNSWHILENRIIIFITIIIVFKHYFNCFVSSLTIKH